MSWKKPISEVLTQFQFNSTKENVYENGVKKQYVLEKGKLNYESNLRMGKSVLKNEKS